MSINADGAPVTPLDESTTLTAALHALDKMWAIHSAMLSELRHAQDSRERAVRRAWEMRTQLRDRCTDLEYECTTRVGLEAACQRLEWNAAEAEALTMVYEARTMAALRHLDAGDLGAARRALEGK